MSQWVSSIPKSDQATVLRGSTGKNFSGTGRNVFRDPAFLPEAGSIDRLAEIAGQGYDERHKSPLTRSAGPGFAHPDHELAIDWLGARERIRMAQEQFER